MATERSDLGGAHGIRVYLSVKENVASCPVHVGLFGAIVVLHPQGGPELIQQFRFVRYRFVFHIYEDSPDGSVASNFSTEMRCLFRKNCGSTAIDP
jgi:hypothetical protein